MHYCEEINQNCNARGKLNCEKKRHNRKKKSLARKVKITRKDQLQEKVIIIARIVQNGFEIVRRKEITARKKS